MDDRNTTLAGQPPALCGSYLPAPLEERVSPPLDTALAAMVIAALCRSLLCRP